MERIEILEWTTLTSKSLNRREKRILAAERGVTSSELKKELASERWAKVGFNDDSVVIDEAESRLSETQPIRLRSHINNTLWLYRESLYECDQELRPHEVLARIERGCSESFGLARQLERSNDWSVLYRWIFPSAVTVVAFLGFVIWALGRTYLNGFYGYFGIRAEDAGVTYVQILERSVISAILLAIVAILFSMALALMLLRSKTLSGAAKGLRAVRRSSLVVTGVLLALLVLGHGYFQQLGYKDADKISATTNANYSVGGLQTIFGSPLVVAWVRWLGDDGQSPLVPATPSLIKVGSAYHEAVTGDNLNLVRIIARGDETTFFLNLADCNVHRVPTGTIGFVNPRLKFSSTEASSPIPACDSRFDE